MDEVNKAVNQMDQVTQQNAAMVEQAAAASHGLARDSQELEGLVQQFRLGTAVERQGGARPTPRGRDVHAAKHAAGGHG